jgi:26 proteasome complex subunit DSS1
MSAPAQGSANASKAAVADTNGAENKEQKKQTGQLEEDDEFEDFPAEDWAEEDTELPSGNQHLWEESWDDDDTTDDFSKQLKEELKKVDAPKRS